MINLGADGSLSLSRTDYESIEKAFHLSIATLPCLHARIGSLHSSKEVHCQTGALERASLVLTAPFTGGPTILSLTYDFSNNRTSAVIFRRSFCTTQDDRARLHSLLESIRHLWSRATLLPVLFLQIYAEFYGQEQRRERSLLRNLEDSVGITKFHDPDNVVKSLERWPASIDVRYLTVVAHSVAARMVLAAEAFEWVNRSAKELLELGVDLGEQEADTNIQFRTQCLHDMLKDTSDWAERIERCTKYQQQRAQIQINVVSEECLEENHKRRLSD